MSKPSLVVMAAGIGSRYGGLKQLDPIGPNGEIIIDYFIYDALSAGFGGVVFIIKRDSRKRSQKGWARPSKSGVKPPNVFQEIEDVPEGFEVPLDRQKPRGPVTRRSVARMSSTPHSHLSMLMAFMDVLRIKPFATT